MHVMSESLAGVAMILAAAGLTAALAQSAAPVRVPAPEAAASKPFVKAEADAVVAELARQLEENFVFPDAGKRYAAMLRANLAAGKYASFPDARAFAEAVTADLQAVQKDGHLRVSVGPGPGGGERQRIMRPGGPGGPQVMGQSAIARSGWLAPGVAYIEFLGFPGNEATLSALRQFISAHAGAKSLIIDARRHRGGGPAEMNVLFPQMFEKETALVGMDTRLAVEQRRGGPPPGDRQFIRDAKGPEGVVRRMHYAVPAAQPMLGKTKVYLLVSNGTGSAGEHLALALKRTHRATLIGETTRGMGHYGGIEPLGHGYAAFIPVGRSFDPDTGEGWEGVGVKPDIEVPADKALDEALRLAGVDKPAELALAGLR